MWYLCEIIIFDIDEELGDDDELSQSKTNPCSDLSLSSTLW